MAARGVLSGKKVTKSHSTTSLESDVIIRAAKKLPEVSKVVIGPIRSRPGHARLKFTIIPAGFRILVAGTQSVQVLYVYTSNPESTQSSLELLI